MLYYFQLQYLRNLRRIANFGMHPLLAVFLVFTLFVGSSFYIFTLEYHQYIYTALTVMCGVSINRTRPSGCVNSLFSQRKLFVLRGIESILVALPFICFLGFYRYYAFASFLVLAAMFTALFPISKSLNFTLPTPFSRKPFEFTMGFRKSILLFLIHLFLLYKAVEVDNFNLGLFALLLVFFSTCSFFFRPENQFFVWIFDKTPSQFLRYKIVTSIRYYLLLIMPSALILLCCFPHNIHFIVGLCLASLPYLIAVIFAKYAAFPYEIQLPQLIFLGISFVMPPFLFVTIPRFYKQSIFNLKSILAHD